MFKLIKKTFLSLKLNITYSAKCHYLIYQVDISVETVFTS